jgi:PAS domain S-box-containing protein
LTDDTQATSVSISPGTSRMPAVTRTALAVGTVLALVWFSTFNYLLFHTLAEFFSITVAAAVCLLAYNSSRMVPRNPLIFLGTALLFVGLIDVFHTLAYKGMGVFPEHDANLPTQLWIAARWLQSLSFLAFAWLIGRSTPRTSAVVWTFSGVTAFLLWSILVADVFPDCFREGSGLTPFKVASEYAICAVLLGSIAMVHHRRAHMDAAVYRFLVAAMAAAVVSELAFTFYVNVYGLSNMVGHLFKIASFFLIYLGLIRDHLTRPFDTLFRELTQAKLSAEHSSNWMQRVAETTPEIIFIYDIIRRRNVYSNQSIAKVLGYSPTELRETPDLLERLTDPRDYSEASSFYRKIADATPGEVRHLTHRGIHKNGDLKWLEVQVTPFTWNERGDLQEVIGMARDITVRKAAEEALCESEARLKAIAEASFDGIVIHGDGRIIDVNEAFGRMYGYAVSELIGKPLLNLYTEESHSIIRHHVDNGLENPYEIAAIRRDGSRFIAEVRGRNTIYKGMKVRGGTLRDITERRRAEEELKASREALRLANEDLEEKVKGRSEELMKAVRKLEKEIERRSQVEQELTRRASQLRALAGELTTTEQRERKRLAKVLHDGMQQYLVAAKLQMEGVIEACAGRSVQQCASQVENLLQESIQVSRSLAAELSPPILHDAGIVAALEWLSRWKHQKHGLKVKLVSEIEDPKVQEDIKVLVFESVRELLLNVLKHSGVKEAKIRLCRTQDNRLQVTVSDSGSGFDPARITSCSIPEGGGFGIFSIRERIQLIGGEFEAYSTQGTGAHFTLTVPMANVEPQESVQSDQSECIPIGSISSKGKIRTLLVDDHVLMREGLARLLSQEPDMEIVGQAGDGQEAVELAERLLPDVVTMDLSMPRLNGVEATRIIHQKHPEMRIIGLSLYTEDERAREMIEAGAVRYLSKAGPPSELKNAIRRFGSRDAD